MSYHLVIEADNVARYRIEHSSADSTYVADGVTLLSQSYVEAYQAAHSLADIHAVLVDLGVTDGLPTP